MLCVCDSVLVPFYPCTQHVNTYMVSQRKGTWENGGGEGNKKRERV